jgi:uncharacterized membrane protein YfcA
MTIYRVLALLAVGVAGGIASSVASVASIVSYPALLALGLPPLAANVTNTMSLVLNVEARVPVKRRARVIGGTGRDHCSG